MSSVPCFSAPGLLRRSCVVALVAVVAVLAVGCAGSRHAPPEPVRKVEVATRISAFALRNGMRVVLVHDATTNLVHVAARYDVGSTSDPEGKAGLAHMVEHLTFLGEVAGRSLQGRLGRDAMTHNAYTVLDATAYVSTAHNSKLEALLEVEALRLQPGLCGAVTPELFAREREVVLNELRTRTGESNGVYKEILATAYPAGHAYRRAVGGDEAQVGSLSLDDACAFMQRYYAPAAVTVVITGNVTRARVQKAIENTLKRIPGRAPGKVAHRQPDSFPPHSRRVALAVEHPVLYFIWPLPRSLTMERAAAEMALSAVIGNLSSIASGDSATTDVGGMIVGGEYAPVAVVGVELTSAGKAKAATKALKKAVREAATFGRDVYREGDGMDEFLGMKQRRLANLVSGFDSLSGRADRFGDYLQLADGKQGYFINELQRVDALSPKNVNKAVARWFEPDAASTLLVTPDPSKRLDYKQVGLAFLGHNGRDDAGIEAVVDAEDARKAIDVPAGQSTLGRARRITLANGLDVIMLASSAVPVVQIRLIVNAGFAAEPRGKEGVAYVAADFLSQKYTNLTRTEISDLRNFIRSGSSSSVSVTDDYTMFRMRGLEGNFDYLLFGLARLVRSGVYDEKRIASYRKNATADLGTKGSIVSQAMARAMSSSVYGTEHPYSIGGFQTKESLRRVGAGGAERFKAKHYVASNATLIVTGKFDVELMEQHVRYHFGPWRAGKPTAAARGLGKATGHAAHLAVRSEKRPTVNIQIAFPVPAGVGKDYGAWRVLTAMLNEQVGSIRQSMAASYGMQVSLEVNKGPGMLTISGDVDQRRAGAALSALLAELRNLRKAVDETKFAVARRAVAGRLAATTNNAGTTGGQLAFIAIHDLPTVFLSSLLRKVAAMRADTVATLIERYLDEKHQTVLLYGPEGAVKAAFKEAGIDDARAVR